MKTSLRQRLLAVAVLSVILCGIALAGVTRIVSLTNGQRLERARETVRRELAALRLDGDAARSSPADVTSLIGMRGGRVPSASAPDQPFAELDGPTREALGRMLHRAETTGDVALTDEEGPDVTRIVAASPAVPSGFAWVAYALKPPMFIDFWHAVVTAITITTVLLVATALSAVASVRRGADALKTSLAALATDLGAPIRRPAVQELRDVADGIARLADALARAQIDKERLGAELARKERLAALGRVAAGVAHEVRNPLASIKLRVDLGRTRQDVPESLARDLGSVSEEITRLDRLVADLLVVAGRRSGPRVPTALGPLAERRASVLAPWAEERGVRLDVTGDALAEVDADAIARALDNLVRNAVEASPPDGTVTIEVLDGEDGARVRVSDQGGGVDAERMAELFEPFFTTKPDGTGLGLALSRSIAVAHEGALTYERRGLATSFELTLPRAAHASPRSEAA